MLWLESGEALTRLLTRLQCMPQAWYGQYPKGRVLLLPHLTNSPFLVSTLLTGFAKHLLRPSKGPNTLSPLRFVIYFSNMLTLSFLSFL